MTLQWSLIGRFDNNKSPRDFFVLFVIHSTHTHMLILAKALSLLVKLTVHKLQCKALACASVKSACVKTPNLHLCCVNWRLLYTTLALYYHVYFMFPLEARTRNLGNLFHLATKKVLSWKWNALYVQTCIIYEDSI